MKNTRKCGELKLYFSHPPEDQKKKKVTPTMVLLLRLLSYEERSTFFAHPLTSRKKENESEP